MNLIIKPVITERSMADAQKGKFTFLVARQAEKPAIKSAVEKAFKVTVKGVETVTVKGKRKRVGARRVEVRETPYKKAVVKLAEGQKIDIFSLGS